MNICICGGGNLGHVITGFIAARGRDDAYLLTRHPERWQKSIVIKRPDNWLPLIGTPRCITKQPEEAVTNADVVVLCLPGFSIREVLKQIKPHLRPDTIVGSVVSSTGFFLEAMEILPSTQPLFGLQRVPFIARTIEYGHEAAIKGYKENLSVAVAQTWRCEEIRQLCEQLFNTPTKLLDSYYEVTLSNSNPLLHPARLYDLWQDWHEDIVYSQIPMFYESWTERASQYYLAMDEELQHLLSVLPVRQGSIPTVLDYYQSSDVVSLTRKLCSIEAFKGIPAPMKPTEGGFVPDFGSRYFKEDFAYGLNIVQRIAQEKGVKTPIIDKIAAWGNHYSHQASK